MLFPTLHSYVIPSRLCTPNISWKYVGLVVNHPREIPLKCRKRRLSKNEDAKAVRHFKENNDQGDDLHAVC